MRRHLSGASFLALALLLSAVVPQATAADAASAAGRPTAEAALLAAVGTLGGANAYASYMAMGAVVDGWVRKVYPADRVARMVAVIASLARSSGAELEAVLASGATEAGDRAYVRGMIDAYGAIVQAAGAVQSWLETGDRAKFDEARDRAWGLLATLAQPAEEALE